MVNLGLATLVFVGIHVFVSGTRLRAVLIGAIGQSAYLGLFALASAASLAWMIWAYSQAPYIGWWETPGWTRHLAMLLMIPSVLLVVIGLSTRNPTAAGADGLLAGDEPAKGIVRITRHPFLWGVLLWALAHVLANGDAAAVVLFGGLGLLATVGPFLIDAKRAAARPQEWAGFAAKTSWLPFAAIAGGRNRFVLGELGWWRIALAVAIYAGLIAYAHEWAFNVSPHG